MPMAPSQAGWYTTTSSNTMPMRPAGGYRQQPQHISLYNDWEKRRAEREAEQALAQRAQWPIRHPGLSEATVTLVVAELRRNRTGAA